MTQAGCWFVGCFGVVFVTCVCLGSYLMIHG